jgi:predicted metal-dependent phosphoesterase TrpH
LKIDLHVHAQERSACAVIGEEEQIRAAILAGLDGIAFTDHNTLVPEARLRELNERFAPFKIFTGIEVDADHEHWIVIGVRDQSLQNIGWHYPELREFVHNQGGFVILAHPFRYGSIKVDLQLCPPDGFEVESYNTPVAREADIRSLAASFGSILLHNSDAHFPGVIGKYYTELPEHPQTDQQLVAALQHLKAAA